MNDQTDDLKKKLIVDYFVFPNARNSRAIKLKQKGGNCRFTIKLTYKFSSLYVWVH